MAESLDQSRREGRLTMKATVTTEKTFFTVSLDNGMSVTIVEAGEDGRPYVRVRQKAREVSPGMYDMGGEYVVSLPDATGIAEACDQRNADPNSCDFPREGTAMIPARHIHG
jgi:hypothetical protein